METSETNKIIAPPQIGLSTVFFRTLVGILGGVIGSAVIFLVIILTQSLIAGIFDTDQSFNPVFIFIVLVMAFLSLQISAITSTSLFSYLQNAKYTRLTSTLVQIFLINLLMFLVMVPPYVVVSQINSEAIMYVAAVHVIFSLIASTLVMEIMTQYRYAILSVYTTIASVMIAIIIISFVQMSLSQILIVPLMLMLPIGWGCVGLFVGLGEMAYSWVYETYGVDYFSLDTNYGEEYSEKIEQEELDADLDTE